ncbi:nuclear transport factor 2 family protein [Glaciibacter superstes]|uniref:nuclear transport factor 2 family protein n=1 Tax=Glaciibacter superstes TaxID=501023 RepID=UPI0003B2E483|nr:nuclear transport factor 2 family protein [Glaciibacter superstes]
MVDKDGPETQNPVESELVVVADEWARAIVSNDVDRIAAFMADEWVIVSESGVSTREQFLAFVGSGKLTQPAMNRNSDARVRAYGDMAVLTMRQTNTAHYGGEQFDADEWVTDVFAHSGGRWACVLSQITAAAAGPPSQATTGSGQG